MRAHPFPLVKPAEPEPVEEHPELIPCSGCQKPVCLALEGNDLKKFQPDHTEGLGSYNLHRLGVRCGPWVAQKVTIGGAYLPHICPTPFDDRAKAIAAGRYDWSDCEGTP
jgi:hypothetical protein